MSWTSNFKNSDWRLYKELWKETVNRTMTPVVHPSFIAFFLLAVVGLGALGIWLELYNLILPEEPCLPTIAHGASNGLAPVRYDSLRSAIVTFFPAVAGTSAMQIMWGDVNKHYRSMSVLLLSVSLVTALLISGSKVPDCVALPIGVAMSVFSLWVWWIANAKQGDLLDYAPAAAVGGDNPQNAALKGDASDWKTGHD